MGGMRASRRLFGSCRGGVGRCCGSGGRCSCIYLKFAEQSIQEEALLTGLLEPTNKWYEIAKIRVMELSATLRKDHGLHAILPMPTSLCSLVVKDHPQNSQMLQALIRRFHEAADAKAPSVTCWGSGSPLREFLHVDDLGEACVFALERWQPGAEEPQFLNVGTGVDLSIRKIAESVAQVTGFTGAIHWDPSKPDGTPKKQLDVSRMTPLGWRARIPLAEGLTSTVAGFVAQGAERL